MAANVYEELLGKTITSIWNNQDCELFFDFSDGETWRMYHDQDCCESVSIEDIAGDLNDLIGSPLVEAEEVESFDEIPIPDFADCSCTWTFYKFRTAKGSVTIRWFGTSNGYYSESVYFHKVEK